MMKAREFLEQESLSGKEPAEGAETSITGHTVDATPSLPLGEQKQSSEAERAGISGAQAAGAQQGKPAATQDGPSGRPDLSRTTAVPLARSPEAAAQPNPSEAHSAPAEAQPPQQQAAPDELATPQAALAAAHAATKLPGSSTACVMRLTLDRRHLMAANVGDSGFALFRNRQLIFQSKPLQHFFDCPLQFADSESSTDKAEDASLSELELQPGDLIVMATDGVWDNLYMDELISLLPKSPEELQRAADAIAGAAEGHAHDDEFDSPYIQEALRQGMDISIWDKLKGIKFRGGRLQLGRLTGGKVDDVTCVLAWAQPAE